jgi:hypothetical protein
MSGMKLPLASKLATLSGFIVNLFPCVSHDDRTISRLGLKRLLLQGVKIWADGVY